MEYLNMDTMGAIKDFIGDEEYISVAPISREWKEIWGSSPPTTLAIDENTSTEKFNLYIESFGGLISNIPVSISTRVARVGKFEFLSYLIAKGVEFELEDILKAATKGGHLNILIEIRNGMDTPTASEDIYQIISPIAVEYGHIHILEWLSEFIGDSIDEFRVQMCKMASVLGQLDVFKWAKLDYTKLELIWDGEEEDNGFEFFFYDYSKQVLSNAIVGGNLDILKYAVEEAGCMFPENAYIGNDYGDMHLDFKWGERLEILKWMMENAEKYGAESWGFCSVEFCWEAARDGKLDLLKLAVQNGGGMDSGAFEIAVENEHSEVVTWMDENVYIIKWNILE